MAVSQYIDDTYGFSKDRVWYSALILVGFCIAFWFVVAGEYPPLCSPQPLHSPSAFEKGDAATDA